MAEHRSEDRRLPMRYRIAGAAIAVAGAYVIGLAIHYGVKAVLSWVR